jgi:hypothetical protein
MSKCTRCSALVAGLVGLPLEMILVIFDNMHDSHAVMVWCLPSFLPYCLLSLRAHLLLPQDTCAHLRWIRFSSLTFQSVCGILSCHSLPLKL